MTSPHPCPIAQPSAVNEALVPVSADRRVFQWHDHASLWFSLGVGLLVMQVGAYLMPALGTQEALWAIVAGSLLGAGLLGWVAKLGCDSGLASAGLMHAVYGRGFASLPIVLNIVQLVGWGTFELVVMRDATVAIGQQSGGLQGPSGPCWPRCCGGGVVMLLISGSMVQLVRKLIARVALPLVVLSLLWLSWQFVSLAQTQGLSALWNRQGAGGMGVLPALDLVIAMPISWLPLVADYARHGKSGGAALRGTWLGYALANMWCYSLGVLVALTLPSTDLVQALLLAQGGLIALSLILIDEVDNAYGDAYSGAVSAHSLLPRWSIRRWGWRWPPCARVSPWCCPCTAWSPSCCCSARCSCRCSASSWAAWPLAPTPTLLAQARVVNALPVALWLAGIAVYHLAPKVLPGAGSALPALAFSFALAWATRPKAR